MEESLSATGELPLHCHQAASPGFSYADYWRSLLAASATDSPAGTVFAAASKRTSETSDAKVLPEPSTSARFIHAATSAYRLRLSLSPDPKSPSRRPLSQKDHNALPAAHVKAAFERERESHGVVQSSTDSSNDGGDYALDAQVLQAARCYEEWRSCLCAEEKTHNARQAFAIGVGGGSSNSSSSSSQSSPSQPSSAAKTSLARATSAPLRVLEVVKLQRERPRSEHEDGVQEIEVSFSPFSTPASTCTVEASTVFSRPASPHAAAVALGCVTSHSTYRSNNETRNSAHNDSSDAHGLTSARADRESTENRTAAARRASASPSLSHSWRLFASPEARLVAASSLKQLLPSTSLRRTQSPSPETHMNSEIATGAAGRTDGFPSPISDCAVTSDTEETSNPSRCAAARVLPRPFPVQRKLFAECGDDDDDDDCDGAKEANAENGNEDRRVIGPPRTSTRKGDSDALTRSETFFADKECDAIGRSRRQPALPPAETVIELSCTNYSGSSSRSNSGSGGGTSDVNLYSGCEEIVNDNEVHSAVAPEDCAASHERQEHQRGQFLLPACQGGSDEESHLSPPGGSSVDAPASSSAEGGNVANGKLKRHPLYVKHHATVAALYAGRLLPSELQNEELQLFLCWAQEKAERQARHWQPAEAAEPQDEGEVPLFPSASPSSIAATDARGVKKLTVSPSMRDVYRRAYAQHLGPQSLCTPDKAKSLSSASPAAAALLRRPPVYVAASPANTATATLHAMESDRLLFTPSSANARFITWIASDVDVYEGLLMGDEK